MGTFINSDANDKVVKKYCKRHKIKPENFISISVEFMQFYVIEHLDKDGNFCTIRVDWGKYDD